MLNLEDADFAGKKNTGFPEYIFIHSRDREY